MAKLNRRTFFRVGATASGLAVLGHPCTAEGTAAREPGASMRAVLVDTTRCVRCRACESACAEANGLPEPAADVPDVRRPDPRVFTVVNRYEGRDPGVERFVKRQCMHCVEPACASACLGRALEKTPTGPVVYHGDRCLGCRYCMVACPFDVPTFEYESPTPFVRKCTFCAERQADGLGPACTSICPSGALTFGTRAALLEEARSRIYAPDSTYVRHIYGEHEAGGSSWLYISDQPLEDLGFNPDVPTVAYSSLTQPALAAVPFVLTLWPPLLMGLYTFSQRREAVAADEAASADPTRKEASRA